MPGGDGTGPLGLGPMTGRAMGYCAGFPVPGYLNPGYGRGRGWWGFGRGLGWRRGWAYPYGAYPYGAYPAAFPAVPFAADAAGSEAEFLRNRAKFLEEELGALKQRLETLETEGKEEKK